MRKREDHKLSKHLINLYDGDFQKIQSYFPMRIGANKIIRDLVHAFVRRTEETAAQKVGTIDHIDVHLEIEQ